jgi:hypothetical protein
MLTVCFTPMIPPTRHSLSRKVPLTCGTVFGSGQFFGLALGPDGCFGQDSEEDLAWAAASVGAMHQSDRISAVNSILTTDGADVVASKTVSAIINVVVQT